MGCNPPTAAGQTRAMAPTGRQRRVLRRSRLWAQRMSCCTFGVKSDRVLYKLAIETPKRQERLMKTDSPKAKPKRPSALPVAPVEIWLAPLKRFLHVESASGIVLLACTTLALILANSPLAPSFAALWKTKVQLSFGGFSLADSLGHLVINDGLMVIFFFVVGLEIK